MSAASGARRVQAPAGSAHLALGYPVIAALASTFRWRAEGSSTSTRSRGAAASRSWPSGTGAFFPPPYYFRRRGIVVITSENFDGEWIAGIIERFGYGTARGSTSRGARKALLQLKRDMAAGKPAGFTLDGPRGPAPCRAARRPVAGEDHRQPGGAVSSRVQSSLDAEQLGSDADPEAVCDHGDRHRRAD